MSVLDFIIWNVSPEIADIGPLSLRWYGLLFASGFLIGQQILIQIYKKEGKSEKHVETLTLYMVLATIIGARLGHCLFYQPDYYLAHPLEILKIWEGGLASHGATVGILLAIYIYSKKTTGQSYFYVLDRLVITIALAGSLIRLGNLMNSEIIGRPTDAPFGFVFIHGTEELLRENYGEILHDINIYGAGEDTIINHKKYSSLFVEMTANRKNITLDEFKEFIQIKVKDQLRFSIDPDVAEHIWVPEDFLSTKLEYNKGFAQATFQIYGVPRHPTQLYESLMVFLLFLFLLFKYNQKREKTPEGRLFAIFVVALFTFRFFVEFLKEPQVEFESTMFLNMGQILSIPLVVAGVFILIKTYKKKNEIA